MWKSIGIQLNYNQRELEKIKHDHDGSDEFCWWDVMEKWLLDEGTSSYPANWDGLYSLLVESGDPYTAKLLRLVVTQAIHPHPSPTSKAEKCTKQQSKHTHFSTNR